MTGTRKKGSLYSKGLIITAVMFWALLFWTDAHAAGQEPKVDSKFALITPALMAGAFAERVSFKGYCVFIALWGLLVYNPLCDWVWAEDGFLFNLGAAGAIDFAGGTVVHTGTATKVAKQ